MKAIFKREFVSFFQNIIGWLFLAATLFVFGLYFYAYNLGYGYAYVSYAVSAISFIMLITVPILTMRILAEDKRSKTDQMILTAPVSVGKIVVAKFLAEGAVFSIAVGAICLSPLFLSAFGTVPKAEAYVSILGFWLYGLTCIAIGTFASALTESQVLSAILSFALLFVGYMMSGITSVISTTDNWFTKVLSCYDLVTPLDSFTSGMLDLTDVVYYLSIIFLFLFLTVQAVQKRRWSFTTKKVKMGVFSSGLIAVVAVITVAVNLVVNALPTSVTNFDLTAEKLYSLTDASEEILQNLDEDVTIYAYVAEDQADTTVANTLKQYEDASSHITVTYVDPAKQPAFAKQYTEDDVSTQTLFVVSDKRSKVIKYSSLYETSYDYSNYSSSTSGYDGEGQITSAIQYVTTAEMPVIYEITGHGETALSGEFSDAIEKANISLESLTLLEVEEIPEDADAIIINGPTADFSADDAKKVTEYAQNGGKLLVTTTYTQESMTNFATILDEFGLSEAEGVVMDTNTGSYYQLPYYLLPTVESATETTGINGYIFAPICQGIIVPESTDELTYTTLLSTSDAAYAKKDVAGMQTYDKEDGDTDGPFAIAVHAIRTTDDTSSEMILVSSQQIFTDDADAYVAKNNSTFFTNCITSFIDTDDVETAVIPVKEYTVSNIAVSTSVLILARLILLFFIPGALLVSGIVIWAVRRKK